MNRLPSSSQADNAPAFPDSDRCGCFHNHRGDFLRAAHIAQCHAGKRLARGQQSRASGTPRVGLGFTRGSWTAPWGHLRPAGLRGEAGPSFPDLALFVAISCRGYLLNCRVTGKRVRSHAFHVVIGHRGHVMARMGIGGRGRLARGLSTRRWRCGCGSCA